jgi:NTP pyrophosphatase (non-canonical NTP hydrolase)
VTYTALGLAGEAGEVADAVKKMIRDDDGSLSWERREKLHDELGDVLWYVAQLCDASGLTMEAVASRNIEKLKDRQQRGKLHGSGDAR